MKKNLLFIADKLSKTLWLLSVIIFISFGVKAGKLPVVDKVNAPTTGNFSALTPNAIKIITESNQSVLLSLSVIKSKFFFMISKN